MVDFKDHYAVLLERRIGVLALSVDSEEEARATVQRDALPFPVVYGLDARREAHRIGAYTDEARGHFHATSFVLHQGRVAQATYSSGAFGRLRAGEVLVF